MAEKVSIELEAKTDKAISELEDLREQVEKLNKEVSDGNKETSKSLKSVEKSSSSVAKGVRGIGTALKAAGIGLIIAAFAQFKEVRGQNQKAADFFATSFEVVSIAFNDFVNFIVNNFGEVQSFFKGIFEDTKQSLLDFADAFKRNINIYVVSENF